MFVGIEWEFGEGFGGYLYGKMRGERCFLLRKVCLRDGNFSEFYP